MRLPWTVTLRAACAVLAAAALVGCRGQGSWRAGWAKVEITPPFPAPLAGYSKRQGRPAAGTRDPLYARAVVLGDGRGRRAAIVVCDLIGVTRELKAAVLARLGPGRWSDDTLLLCATHTHSGPGAATENPLAKIATGDFDPRMPAFLTDRIAAAVRRADKAARRVRLSVAQGEAPGLARNRRRADGPVARTLDVLRIVPPEGGGVLVAHFAMHPTVLPAGNMRWSADFPGAFARAVEAAGYEMGVFVNGAEGDQAPVPVPGATPSEAVEATGRRLAAAALTVAAEPGRPLPARLFGRAAEVGLPPSAFAAVVPSAARVQVLDVGGLLLYAVPGEPVAEVGEVFAARAAALGCDAAWLVALANDHLGYFDTPAGFALNSYESNLTFHGPAAWRTLLDALPALAPGGAKVGREIARTREADRARAAAASSARRRGGGWFLRLAGSPWQMGYQHGTLLGRDIRNLFEEFRGWIDRNVREDAAGAGGWLPAVLRPLRPSAVLVPWLCVKARELQPFIPRDLLEEMAGLAEGAWLPYDEVLLMNVFLTMAEQPDRTRFLLTGPRGTCTNLVCLPPRTAGAVVHGRNLDWGMENLLPPHAATILYEPAGGFPFVSVGWAGLVGTLTCMNAEGLSITEESVAARHDTRYHGEPVMLLLRDVIRRARTLDQAVRMLAAAPGTCGYHITVVDGNIRDARVVEKSATRAAVRRPSHGLLPGVDLDRRPEVYEGGRLPPAEVPWTDASSTRRYGRLARLVAEVPAGLSPDDVRGFLRDRAGGIDARDTLHSVVLLPGRFAGWVAHGSTPAPDAGYEWYDFNRELTRHRLLGPTRARFAAAFGATGYWDRVEEPVEAVLEEAEPPGPGRPYRISVARMPSAAASGVPGNDTLWTRLYEPVAAAWATVLFLPMWSGHERDAEDLIARALAAQGARVAVMPMAYQWRRAPPGVRSGALTVSADPARTRAAIAQTAADVERLARWLADRYPEHAGRLGLMGLSLGGFVASSLFAADPQFAAGIFVLAGGDAADALFSGTSDVRSVREALDARGVSRARVRRDYAGLSPAGAADPARGGRVLLVNALFDRVVSWENARRLRRAWGNPDVFVVPADHHTAVFFLDPFVDRCVAHLRKWLEPAG